MRRGVRPPASRWTRRSTPSNTISVCVQSRRMQPELQPADVLESYPPHADTILTLLASRAAARPEHPALEFEGRVWTYAALDGVSTSLALAAAHRNVNKGDRIAVVSVNTDLSVIIFLAAAKIGALFVPLNPAATDKD